MTSLSLLDQVQERFELNARYLHKANFLLERMVFHAQNPAIGGGEKALQDAKDYLALRPMPMNLRATSV